MRRWPVAAAAFLSAGLVLGGVAGHSLLKGEPPAATPVPLGVVAPTEPTAVPWPTAEKGAQYQPAALLNATLLISLEPEGGVAATPTGPVLFEGKLSPAR